MFMSQTPKQGRSVEAEDRHSPGPGFVEDPIQDRADGLSPTQSTHDASDARPTDSRPTDSRPTRIQIPVAGAGRPAAAARRAVVEHCRDRVSETVIEDLQIIVSELVANVLEHGGGPEGLAIDLEIRAGDVDIQVTGHGDRRLLPPASAWDLPPADQPTGRGLALVRCLSGEVEVAGVQPSVDDVGRVTITASVPLTAA